MPTAGFQVTHLRSLTAFIFHSPVRLAATRTLSQKVQISLIKLIWTTVQCICTLVFFFAARKRFQIHTLEI